MELDEESAKLVTINTHQGLYESTRLPFGVASAPAIFQRAMDMVLQGIPHCICYLDDILITGGSDSEHFRNLEEVLRRLQDHGIRLKKEKCHFMRESVEYLGHHVDARGVHTSKKRCKPLLMLLHQATCRNYAPFWDSLIITQSLFPIWHPCCIPCTCS